VTFAFFPDCDRDGYGNDAGALRACTAPDGVPPVCPAGVWSSTGGDCNDSDRNRNPRMGCEAGVDGGVDAGVADAGERDGGLLDGGTDAGAHDAGFDGGTDAGPLGCGIGAACTSPCGMGLSCQGEASFTQGGTDDPVYLPDGGTTSYTIRYFAGGLCTNATLADSASRLGSPGACNPRPADPTPGLDGCPACAKCISLGSDGAGGTFVQCFPRCELSGTSNPCRAGYTCDPSSRACLFGCQSDQECQVYRADTDGSGGNTTGDRLTLDVAGGASCSPVTGRCTQPGTPGAVAGIRCTLSSECEADGYCVSAYANGWPGGYCTKFGCDVLGCAGDATCLDIGAPNTICAQPCAIGDDPGDAAIGATGGDDDCRDGYSCEWDKVSPLGARVGGCIPGNYNSVTTPNVGTACADNAECWSPYGRGACIFSGTEATCSVLGCANLPDGVCGEGNVCLVIDATTSACVRTCTAPETCAASGGRSSYGCVDLSPGDPDPTRVCWPECLTAADCNAGFSCTLTGAGRQCVAS
jgi:hypothetical protein